MRQEFAAPDALQYRSRNAETYFRKWQASNRMPASMRSANHARVERPHHVLHGHGACTFAADGGSDQGLLQRTGPAFSVARREIPGGGSDDLVTGNPAAAEFDPMAETAARGLDKPGGAALALRLVVGAERLIETQ